MFLKRSVRKQILIDEETSTKIKEVAEKNLISENELINRALSAYLKRFKAAKPA